MDLMKAGSDKTTMQVQSGKQNCVTAATAGRGHEPTPATTNPQIELFLLCVFVLTAKYEQYTARTNSSGHKITEVKFVVCVCSIFLG